MKKEITPEMYNYNKFPGPKFERLVDQIQAEGICFTLVENYKEAFDVTAFEQRYVAHMLKFDYIVGDWGNEQLRLKGFYKDEQDVPNELKISRLQDYLLEYCNYGCAYFVLENSTPVAPESEPEDELDRRTGQGKRRRRRSRSKQRSQAENPRVEQTETGRHQTRPKKKPASKQKDRHFNIKAEKREQEKKKETKQAIQHAQREFVIRQK